MEPTDIYSYLRHHSPELGSRILEMYPPLQSTTEEVPPELSSLLRKPLLGAGNRDWRIKPST